MTKDRPKAQDDMRMGSIPLENTRTGLNPKTGPKPQDKTRQNTDGDLSPRHNKGKTQISNKNGLLEWANL